MTCGYLYLNKYAIIHTETSTFFIYPFSFSPKRKRGITFRMRVEKIPKPIRVILSFLAISYLSKKIAGWFGVRKDDDV